MTLTEFLTARFDEDEAKARAATQGPWVTVAPHEWSTPLDGELLVRTAAGEDYWQALITPAGGEHGDDGLRGPDAEHIARHDPARVLAEVAAKRRIVEYRISEGFADDGMVTALRALASVYAEHPDFREEWRA